MIADVTSESSPTRSERAVVVKSTPHVTRGEPNVSEEFANRLRVVAVNDQAKPLFFLGFEEESGHLEFVHLGTSGRSGHVDDHTG